jgi:acyl-CoA synthetase (NDP forming)
MLQQIPSRLPRRIEFNREKARALIQAGIKTQNQLLTELESKALLSAYGIPANRAEIATTQAEAVKKAKDIGFPVVIKSQVNIESMLLQPVDQPVTVVGRLNGYTFKSFFEWLKCFGYLF